MKKNVDARTGSRGAMTHRAPAMESVIPTVSDRDMRTEAERGIKGELEASPFADGIKFSARPRAPAGI